MSSNKSVGATPKKIGKYRVEKVLGRGAMGIVYLATDPTINRPVALKTIVLPEGLDEDKVKEFRIRFLREAQAAGRLNHPSIVTVYEADDGSNGEPPFIAMEYVEGLPWNFKIRQGIKQDPDAILPLVREIASALDYAHSNGIIHRDIKPANIVQTPNGHVKLMDFGIAKVPSSELTQDGQFLGTPAYMSPEQFKGKPMDGRSDLFSLGTVLYELLTCKKPFPGEEITVVGYKICRDEPESVLEINPSIPPEVVQILRYLLAKDPGNRYAKARQLVEDIDAYLAGAALPHAGTAFPVTGKPKKEKAKAVPPRKKRKNGGRLTRKRATRPPAGAKERTQKTGSLKKLRGLPPMLLLGSAVFIVLFLLGAASVGILAMLHPGSDLELAPPPRHPISLSSLFSQVTYNYAKAGEELAMAPIILNESTRHTSGATASRRWRPERPPKKKAKTQAAKAMESTGTVARKEGGTPLSKKPAVIDYSFTSRIVKGDFKIDVDKKTVVEKTIKHKFFSRHRQVYTGSFQLSPGSHTITFEVKTKMQNITGKHTETKAFAPGQKRSLVIVMTRFRKELRFEWGD